MRAFQEKDILLEDDQLLVVRKYAGMAVQSARLGQMDLEHALLAYLAEKQRVREGGNGRQIPYLAVVHRLDQPVEGLLVFGKTRRAAAELGRQVQDGRMEKRYLAVVSGSPRDPEGRLTDLLVRDGKTNLSRAVAPGTPKARQAALEYRVLDALEPEEGTRVSLLEIRLLTGRHHQIRVQLAHAGLPILGDGKYGTGVTAGGLALCAASLAFRHPATGQRLTFRTWPQAEAFAAFAPSHSVDFS